MLCHIGWLSHQQCNLSWFVGPDPSKSKPKKPEVLETPGKMGREIFSGWCKTETMERAEIPIRATWVRGTAYPVWCVNLQVKTSMSCPWDPWCI